VARRSVIRASDADRESVVERLRQASGEGRLAAHELEHRVAAALKATTYGELDATVSDLPGAQPRRRRSSSGRTVATVRAHPGLILVAVPVVAVVVAAVVVIAVLWAMVAVLALMLGHHRRVIYRGPWTWHQRQLRASRQNAAGGFTPWL
jgi:Flp pilus assembly protein TadB